MASITNKTRINKKLAQSVINDEKEGIDVYIHNLVTGVAAIALKDNLSTYLAWIHGQKGQFKFRKMDTKEIASLQKVLIASGLKRGFVKPRAFSVIGEPIPGILNLATSALADPIVASYVDLPQCDGYSDPSIRVTSYLRKLSILRGNYE